MRLSILTLALGLVAGFSLHALLADHPEWLARSGVEVVRHRRPDVPARTSRPSYPDVEKVLSRLKKDYDGAVIVALTDEIADPIHKVVHRTVLEVWKGPEGLKGKSISVKQDRPMTGSAPSRLTTLVFMPLTPYLTTSASFAVSDGKLRLNPTITLDRLRATFEGSSIVEDQSSRFEISALATAWQTSR